MRHDTIVVTSWQEKGVKAAHDVAMRLLPTLTSPVVQASANGYSSFFIAPDGSKEGWEMSIQADVLWEDFRCWARECEYYLDVLSVSFGGDSPAVKVMIEKTGEQ